MCTVSDTISEQKACLQIEKTYPNVYNYMSAEIWKKLRPGS